MGHRQHRHRRRTGVRQNIVRHPPKPECYRGSWARLARRRPLSFRASALSCGSAGEHRANLVQEIAGASVERRTVVERSCLWRGVSLITSGRRVGTASSFQRHSSRPVNSFCRQRPTSTGWPRSAETWRSTGRLSFACAITSNDQSTSAGTHSSMLRPRSIVVVVL
jgi:hypothetical protein